MAGRQPGEDELRQTCTVTAHSAVCPVQIGREAEVAQLASNAQRRVMTLIVGEAGVGKSRLVSEAVRVAQELGLARFVGNCSATPTVPYAPFVSAIRRQTRTLDAAALAQLFEGPALLAAALLPETARALGLPKEAPEQEGLVAAVWQVVHRLAAPTGGLVLLEDIHWADADSLQLLSYLAHDLAGLDLWLVGPYRSDELHRRHPLTLTLASLSRERRYEEISLVPLQREELRQMLSAIFNGSEISDELVDALLDRTAGNLFFFE